MAKRPTISTLTNLRSETSAVATINENLNNLADAVEGVLSTSTATDNTMNVPLDMNGQRILNLPLPVNPSDPARLTDVVQIFEGVKGNRILTATRAPEASDGTDGDFFIEDRSFTNQGRLMYGPKTNGVWPNNAWNIEVSDVLDVPGFTEALNTATHYPPDLSGTVERTIDMKLREQAKSFLDFMPNSISNAIMSGVVVTEDLTTYLQSALDSGRDLFMPSNLPTLTRMRVTKALRQTKANQRVYWALGAQLVYDRPRVGPAPNGQPGTAIEPVWIMMQSAVGAELWHLNIDHQGTLYGNPTIGGGNLGLGSALLIMADQAYAHRCVVQNAWDNGIAIADFGSVGDTVEQNNGKPRGVTVCFARTLNCGCGPHDDGTPGSVGHEAGGGINNLTGSATIIYGCVDVGSSTNFIQDFKAGCDGHWSGCSGTFARRGSKPYLGQPAGGIGMYFAGSGTVEGLKIDDCAGPGLIVDGTASNATFIHVRVKSAAEEGIKAGGTNISLISPRAQDCSYNQPGAFPAILLYGTGDAGGGLYGPANNINLYDPQTTGPFHRRGVELKREQGGVPGRCVGGTLNGTLEPYGPLSERLTMPEFTFEAVRTSGQNALRSTGQRSIDNTNTNAVAFPFGTPRDGVPGGVPNGTLFLRDENDSRKELVLGYDPIRNMGVLQAILEGVQFVPLSLNPGGGDVQLLSVLNRVFSSDSAAAAAGVGVGSLYINSTSGDLRIRRS